MKANEMKAMKSNAEIAIVPERDMAENIQSICNFLHAVKVHLKCIGAQLNWIWMNK